MTVKYIFECRLFYDQMCTQCANEQTEIIIRQHNKKSKKIRAISTEGRKQYSKMIILLVG